MLTEVNRFPPPEPADATVAGHVTKMQSAAGAEAAAAMNGTGVDEQRLLELARETLRIELYIAQRFGAAARGATAAGAVAGRSSRPRRRNGVYSPAIATRSTSSELNPAWLTSGAMLLRRRRYITAHTTPSTPVVTAASHPCSA